MSTTHFLSTTANLDNLSEIRRFVGEAAKSLRASPSTTSDLQLAVDEVVSNVSIHGYGGTGGYVELEVGRQGRDLFVRLRDKAPIFDPTALPAPDVGLNCPPGTAPLGGLGVYLIKQVVDEMRHRSADGGGNELILVKRGVFPSR
jgi:serine/threonine-protein kinase RsbW